jgi:hypothetical protein
MTHGAELYNNFMHPENVKLSYSQHLATQLNVDLLNVAMSASSNEYIFHSIMEELEKHNNIHSVIVMWTSTGRLYWKNKNRHYFFLGSYAGSMIDLNNFEMHDLRIGDLWFVGDNDQIVTKISEIHKFIVTDYFDNREETKKLKHYQKALQSICSCQNIKLIQLDWLFLVNILGNVIFKRHPTADEHKIIADNIYRKYYENKFN